jgi:cyclin-dependent kinase 2
LVVKILHRDKAELKDRWQKTAQEDGATLTLEEYTEAVSTYEAEIMRTLKHEHIVRIIDCRDGGTASNMVFTEIYMEKLDCDLAIFITNDSGTITRAEKAEMARQICLGLVYLHGQGLMHGDLKPENVLVDKKKNVLKLADFGSAVELEIGESTGAVSACIT